jgi:hypothetical protein
MVFPPSLLAGPWAVRHDSGAAAPSFASAASLVVVVETFEVESTVPPISAKRY